MGVVIRVAGLVSLSMLLVACITTSSKPPAPVSEKDAAQYNMQLGIGYLRNGDLKTAQAKLEKAIAADSSLATAHLALGVVMERLEDNRAAEKYYRRAVSLDPDDPDTLNALGAFLCLKKGETQEALRYFDKALTIPLSKAVGNRAMVNANAGLCAKRVDLERAETYLRAALAADPKYPDALLQLADVTYARGNALQARGFLERYFASTQATPDALWLGVRVENALGATDTARRYAARLKRDFPTAAETRLLLEGERNGG